MALLLAGLGLIVTRQAARSRANLPQYGMVTTFSFTRSEGGTFTDKDLRGKISVVDFIFTSCGGVCPVMTSKMNEVYRLFQGTDVIQFVSISVDPQNDTPEVLAAYAREHGVNDGRWVFLTGPIEDVVNLTEKGFLLPADNLPGAHTSRFILLDPQGRIRGYYDGTGDMGVLIEHIRQLAKVKT
jgi:protein SCO1/2